MQVYSSIQELSSTPTYFDSHFDKLILFNLHFSLHKQEKFRVCDIVVLLPFFSVMSFFGSELLILFVFVMKDMDTIEIIHRPKPYIQMAPDSGPIKQPMLNTLRFHDKHMFCSCNTQNNTQR